MNTEYLPGCGSGSPTPAQSRGPLLALDAHYDEPKQRAVTAGVVFEDWSSSEALDAWWMRTDGVAAYEPGSFYRRELPCLLPMVEALLELHPIRVIVVDGFVDLGGGRPGLGRHLFNELDAPGPEVVGVAKNPFAGALATPVYRNESRRPLWVGATGDRDTAVHGVLSMAGQFRLPKLLKQVDRLARLGHRQYQSLTTELIRVEGASVSDPG